MQTCFKKIIWVEEIVSLCKFTGSDAALVAPEADVEAVAEFPAVSEAELGDAFGVSGEFFGGAAFGHEQDPVAGDVEAVDEVVNFFEVGIVADDKFEPSAGRLGEPGEGVGRESQRRFHARVGEFW